MTLQNDTEVKRITVLNMGAGVQTTALLLENWKAYDYVVFADTGDERQETYEYIENYLKPFCESKNLKWVTVKAKKTLMQHCLDRKIIPIVTRRWCTEDFKIKPIRRFLRSLGATAKNPIISHIGISLDESHRANFNNDVKYQLLEYPLVDRKITRDMCKDIILKHGFPLPSKSGCDFCMFNKRSWFRELAIKQPERFKQIVEMEKNSYTYGKYYLQGKYPLEMIISNSKLDDFIENEIGDTCDSGHCFV